MSAIPTRNHFLANLALLQIQHQPLRFRQAPRFLDRHAVVSNLFNLGIHLISAEHHRKLRTAAFYN